MLAVEKTNASKAELCLLAACFAERTDGIGQPTPHRAHGMVLISTCLTALIGRGLFLQEEEFADTGYQVTPSDQRASSGGPADVKQLGALTAEDFYLKPGAATDESRLVLASLPCLEAPLGWIRGDDHYCTVLRLKTPGAVQKVFRPSRWIRILHIRLSACYPGQMFVLYVFVLAGDCSSRSRHELDNWERPRRSLQPRCLLDRSRGLRRLRLQLLGQGQAYRRRRRLHLAGRQGCHSQRWRCRRAMLCLPQFQQSRQGYPQLILHMGLHRFRHLRLHLDPHLLGQRHRRHHRPSRRFVTPLFTSLWWVLWLTTVPWSTKHLRDQATRCGESMSPRLHSRRKSLGFVMRLLWYRRRRRQHRRSMPR